MPKTIVIHRDWTQEEFTLEKIIAAIRSVVAKTVPEEDVESIVATILTSVELKLPEKVTTKEFDEVVLKAVEQKISSDTIYDQIAAGQMIKIINSDIDHKFKTMKDYVEFAVEKWLLDKRLLDFDFAAIENALNFQNDKLFNFFGIATFYDRYLMRDRKRNIIEKPQWAWMRVAMWISLAEKNKTDFALKVYERLSAFKYIHATPTLYNSWVPNAQFSSCYINVVGDSMDGIFSKLNEVAQFAKYAWWVGTSITKLRASWSYIKSLNAKSSGPIPFIKIFDTTMNSIMQGGRRRSSECMYMEPWHYNIYEFLDLKETNGSPYLRTPSLNTAIWAPDCFMERIEANQDRWMFDPAEAPELTTTWGEEFTKHYNSYCEKAEKGELQLAKKVPAKDLYDRILFQLAKTGNYWMNYKDTHNRANQAPTYSMIHSSNLCTEISIPNSEESTAVCTLASINLSKFYDKKALKSLDLEAMSVEEKIALVDWDDMKKTIEIAVRALDNAMDLNFYPSPESLKNTMDLRPMGLGIMGTAEMYIDLAIAYTSDDAIALIDKIGEFMYSAALEYSKILADERWTFGHYNKDTYDYAPRRNALLMSIQPTASTSLIMGTSSMIDPYFANVYSRETLGGKYTIVIEQLVEQLKAKWVWDEDMKNKIIANQWSIQDIEELDGVINKELFKTSYETGWRSQIDIAAKLQNHIDQAISRNMYIKDDERGDLQDIYMYAWKQWLKGTYYCFIEKKIVGEKYTQTVNKRWERKGFGSWSQTQATQSNAPRWFATRITALNANAETVVMTDDMMKSLDFNNITSEQKVAIRTKLVAEKWEEYVNKLEKWELYANWACPMDPFEKVMCEGCQ